MFRFSILLLSILGTATVVAANTVPDRAHYVSAIEKRGLTESQKVERLIQFVRNMEGATFIRNGSEHTCQQAADHLQSKWEKHKDNISSAKEFIEKLASHSGMSGEDYKIRLKDGSVHTTSEILTKELERLEQS